MYECPVCGAKCSTKDNLRAHVEWAAFDGKMGKLREPHKRLVDYVKALEEIK